LRPNKKPRSEINYTLSRFFMNFGSFCVAIAQSSKFGRVFFGNLCANGVEKAGYGKNITYGDVGSQIDKAQRKSTDDVVDKTWTLL
jgi:hypothetical protein